MSKYRYIKGTENNREMVEFEGLSEPLRQAVTMHIDVDLLLCGINKAQYGNGCSVELEPRQRYDILKLVQEEREKIITATSPKSQQSWHDSGLGQFGEYFRVGDEVTEELVDYFMDLLPPAYMGYGMLQVGEPYSHENDPDTGKWRATYTTFVKSEGKWRYVGECFYKQEINRVKNHDRVAKALAEAEREVGQCSE